VEVGATDSMSLAESWRDNSGERTGGGRRLLGLTSESDRRAGKEPPAIGIGPTTRKGGPDAKITVPRLPDRHGRRGNHG
jgi:hypothetical protein